MKINLSKKMESKSVADILSYQFRFFNTENELVGESSTKILDVIFAPKFINMPAIKDTEAKHPAQKQIVKLWSIGANAAFDETVIMRPPTSGKLHDCICTFKGKHGRFTVTFTDVNGWFIRSVVYIFNVKT